MRFLIWAKDIFIESLNQTWTLLGMFIAWVLLEGSARTVVGYAIMWSLTVWLLTLRLREPVESNEEKEDN